MTGKYIGYTATNYVRKKALAAWAFETPKLLMLPFFPNKLWSLLHDPNSLLAHLLKAKYYANNTILIGGIGHHLSYTWKGLWEAKLVIIKGSRWMIGDGNSVDIWSDCWIIRESSFKIITVITNYKDWIFIDSIGLQSLWIQSSDSFSQGWIFQPLKQRGWGPIYRKIPPPKSRQALTWVMGLDLGFGPFNQALP